MGGTGSASVDAPRMISLEASKLYKRGCGCGCGCACHSGDEGGEPSLSVWAGPSHQAVVNRRAQLEKLIPAVKALLKVAREALDQGDTNAAEIRDVQRVEIWLVRLLAEEDRLRDRDDNGGGGGGGGGGGKGGGKGR